MKSIPYSKEALLLVMLAWRFHIKVLVNVLKKFWHRCSLSPLYSTCNNEILNCIHCIQIVHYTCNPSSPFHQDISPCTNSWFLKSLPYCRKQFKFQEVATDFMRNSHTNVLSKDALSKWMHFQNVLSLWEL